MDLLGRALGDLLAMVEHHDLVRDLVHDIELVLDEEDGEAELAKAPNLIGELQRMTAASSGGSLFETTMESSDFSAGPIPDSVFAIPAGYQQSSR